MNLFDKLWDKPSLLDPIYFKLLSYCYKQAARSPGTVTYKGIEVAVEAGEFVTGREKLATDMNDGLPKKDHLSELTWLRRLKDLENEAIVSTRSTNKYTIVKIADVPSSVPEGKTDKEVAAGTELQPEQQEEKPKKSKKPKDPQIAKVYGSDDDAMKVAKWIHKKCVDTYGNAYPHTPSDGFQEWAKHIDTLLNPSNWAKKKTAQIDTYEERCAVVKEVLVWVWEEDDFWKKQVRTAPAFVKKFDRLRMEMIDDKNKQGREVRRERTKTKTEEKLDWIKQRHDEAKRREMNGDEAMTFLLGGDGPDDGNGIQ